MQTLGDRRRQFSGMVGQFLVWCYDQGYEVEIEEVKRSKEQAAANAASGAGIVNSLHLLGLAIDVSLFRNKVLLTTIEDYRPLGDQWKSMGGSWGGDFHKPDVDHFSLDWQGVR